MTTAAQYEKVQEYFRLAQRGRSLRRSIGGALPEDPDLAKGFFVPPTVYAGVRNDMRIAREEIFGPVASVIPFARRGGGDRDRQRLRLRPGMRACGPEDVSRAHRVAARLEAGQVFVNDWLSGTIEQPFGGYKQSGYGREKGIEALHHYTQLKSVTIRL